MIPSTKRLLAKALLLPKDEREDLIDAIREHTRTAKVTLSKLDLTEVNALIDELLKAADVKGTRRRRKESDVPTLWRSHFYLRQGYHLANSTHARGHWQGGEPQHRTAICSSCGKDLHLLWDINCRDPRFRRESPQVFGPLRRLPLYYCLRCPQPTVYRCVGKSRLQMLESGSADSSETPFSGFPDVFPRTPITFKAIPPDIENLILISRTLGHGWLRSQHKKALQGYLAASSGSLLRRSQLGGLPVVQQLYPELVCPYDHCPTHCWGHPVMRTASWFSMKLLATIESDAGFKMETDGAQIIFHICWACHTIHGDHQID
jgi:hypothetical protein